MNSLNAMKIWVCWQWSVRKGKRTKVPISANGCATGTDEAYSCTWVTRSEAEQAATDKGYDGIGFIIPEGYFFLDIDHREITDPYVQTILERFSSYAEFSVSGNGIHIYGKYDLSIIPTYEDKNGRIRLGREFYTKSPNGVELYFGGITNRYAVVTGNTIKDSPVCDCTEALLTTLHKDMRRNPKPQCIDGCNDAVFDIVADLRKARNGEKFSALYDRGDMSAYLHEDGSPDQSRADCALASLIAFRTGPDPELIYEVIKGSALYRKKWERDDYRENTIQAGIDACNGVFHRSVMPAPYFVKFDKNNRPSISIPLLAKYTKENLHYILVRNDGKEGIRLYVYENGVYRLYAEDMLHAVIKGYIEDYDLELVQMSKIVGAANIILTDLNYVRQDELNSDDRFINFKNGLLRLSDLALQPHTPDVLTTIQMPCNWVGRPTDTPVYDGYVSKLMNYDPAMINLCNEICGAVISNVQCFRMKRSAFFLGDGNTGKSQLKSLVEQIIGPENFIGIDLKEIEARFGTGAIYGTRLAGSSDMSFLSVGELKTFKSLTGGDQVMAEFKGRQQFAYRYNGFLWFCMNRLPRFGGDDGKWVFDRIMILQCPNVIPEEEQDKMLLEKLLRESDGIVYKAVMALRNVISNGYRFTEPVQVIEARQAYMENTNTAIAFFLECMEERSTTSITDGSTTGKIYAVYKAWCQDNNNGYAKTAKEFRDAIAVNLGKDYSDLIIHTRKGSFYRDYTLTEAARAQYSKAYGYDGADFLS